MSENNDVPPKNKVPPGVNQDVEAEERWRLYESQKPTSENQTELTQEISGQPSITNGMLAADGDRRDTWLQYNKGLMNRGYTPARALTPDNVDNLKREYVIEEDQGGLQTQPIITPGDPPTMYYTVWGLEHVVAVNARTGEEYWRFKSGRPQIIGGGIPQNRGVCVWKDKVYYASDRQEVIAIDRFTGEELWSTSILATDPEVGEQSLTRTYMTQMPLAYDGKIYLGQSSDRAEWTVISCIDAETGELLWQTPTYVSKDKWAGLTWRTSSCACWNGVTVDPDSHTVFFHTGNADPAGGAEPYRPGPNRASDGIGALDADTGEYKWTNQVIAHDTWDWDVAPRPYVFDVEIEGETRRVVAADGKTGYSYTIDVETGQTLSRSEPVSTVEDKHTHPPLHQENSVRVTPGGSGSIEWPPDSFNPKTGLRYISVFDNSEEFWTEEGWDFDADSPEFVGGWWGDMEPEAPNPYVVALDPVSGDIKWQYVMEDGYSTAFPGGVTSTGGDLIFVASNGGNLSALNLDGEELWVDDTKGRIEPTPCVWDDVRRSGPPKQYVAAVSDNRIITYTH